MDEELIEPLLNPHSAEAEDDDYSTYLLEYPTVEVHFLNIHDKTCFNKVQSRRGGETRMRVEDGVVHLVAISSIQIASIKVWVFREPGAAELHCDRQGKVELPVRMGRLDTIKQYFSVNLDDVYHGPEKPVYELAKVEMDKRNRFQLSSVLYFIDGSSSQDFYSSPFSMRSKPRPPKRKSEPEKEESNVMEPEVRRLRGDSNGSGDSGLYQGSPGGYSGSTGGDSDTSSPRACQAGQEVVKIKKLRVVDQLEASRAKIDHLTFTVLEPSGKADLGYHLRLSDPEVCGQYNEGDVVAFCEGENGQTQIELLTNENIGSAFLAGVISRSAYIEAKPRGLENDKTDVVCVIGVVKVKCMGTVQAGERVYASVDTTNPGIAIPESSLPANVILSKDNNMLGMSLESSRSSSPHETHLVKCFVCIVLGVQNKQITMEIENMYDQFEMELMVRLRRERKKMRKVVCRVILALVVLLGLLGVLLYQVFYPGTAFRYWMCERGCIRGSTAQFKYIPLRDTTQRYLVHGVEFNFDDLMRKLSYADGVTPIANKTVFPGRYRYYLNLDRCAYGGNRLGGPVFNKQQVGGPKIFAVNYNCTKAFYYVSPPNAGWKMYQSVQFFRGDLKCSV